MPDEKTEARRYGLGSLIYNFVSRILYGTPRRHRPRRPDKEKRPGATTFGDEDQSLYSFYGERMRLGKTRFEIYDEIDNMDADDLPAATLDTYAEDATTVDPASGKTVWVEDCHDDVRKLCDECLERIKIEEYAFLIVRQMAKYGDFPVELYWEPGEGIQTLRFHHPKKFKRFEELETAQLVGFYLGDTAMGAPEPNIHPWEVVHFRIFGNLSALYGTSLLAGARRTFRRLRLSEDASVIYRIQRHPDRDVFHLDTTGMTDAEQAEYLNRFAQGIRKNRYYDPTTGELRTDWNPFTGTEDLIIPQIQGHETKIERLVGSKNANDVADLDWHLARYHASVRVPPAHFGYMLQGAAPYSPERKLTHQDSRYARIPGKLQHYFLVNLYRLLQLNLAFAGIDAEEDTNKFTLVMAPVSFLEELHRQQLIEIRIDIIDRLMNMGQQMGFDMSLWIRYVLKEYGKLSDDIIDKLVVGQPQAGAPAAPGGPPKPGGPKPPAPPPMMPPEMPPAGGAPGEEGPPSMPPGEFEALPSSARSLLMELQKRIAVLATQVQEQQQSRRVSGVPIEGRKDLATLRERKPEKRKERTAIGVEGTLRSEDSEDLNPPNSGKED